MDSAVLGERWRIDLPEGKSRVVTRMAAKRLSLTGGLNLAREYSSQNSEITGTKPQVN